MELEAPAVGDPARRWRAGAQARLPIVLVGDGAVLYAGDASARRRRPAAPLCRAARRRIGRLASRRARRARVDPAGGAAAVRPPPGRRDRSRTQEARSHDRWPDADARGHRAADVARRRSTTCSRSRRRRSRIRGRARCTSPSSSNRGVSFCYLASDAGGRVVGFCSFWRVLDELHINNLAVLPERRRAGRRRGAARARAAATAPARARGAPRSRCGGRTSRPARCTSGSGSRWPASGAATTRKPVEDALVLWRERVCSAS